MAPRVYQPGLSLASLIDQAGERTLRELVGESLVDILKRLDPKLAAIEKLRIVAKRLIATNSPAPVRDDLSRRKLIDALPLDKARELCSDLSIPLRGDIYEVLKRIDLRTNKAAEQTFFRFFGIVEDRIAPQVRKPTATTIKPNYDLFPHQRDVVAKALAALREYPRKVVVHMPTGAGKTRTAMHIVARHLIDHGPTLVCWLANSAELLDQAAEDFESSWAALGDRPVNLYRFWGDRLLDLADARDGVLIAGLAKLYSAYQRDANMLMRLGDRASLTVIDEAHQSVAPTYRSVIEGLYTKRPNNALLGLTATPGRTWADIGEDAALAEFFGNKKVTLQVDGYSDPVSFLIKEGYLAQPTFRTLESGTAVELSDEDRRALISDVDVPEMVLERLADDGERNLKILAAIEDLIKRHHRILVFAATVAHANLIAAILTVRGHDAEVVTAETPIHQRERLIRKFCSETRRPMVLCNYGVLTTGFNAPKTSAAVIARPTKSLVLYSQMVGRATRGTRAGGNKTAEIVTVVDTSLPGFGSITEAFHNWEDVWHERC